MTDGKKRGGTPEADLEGLARRFQDLWQDQMAAVAADPDFAEMMGKWFGAAATGAPPPGPTAGPFSAPFPGMMPGAAFGQMDPAAWLKALGLDASGGAAAGSKTADDPTAAKATSPTGAKATPASSGSGDAAGHQLEHRLADLEQRLERLEAAIGGTRGSAAKGPRKRRS